ncbi:MAG TPA: type II toxin-antitoxin system VapB family antitoxin [Acidobacteriota bacterium]|nr:type II toxin-antitoxin system VapB family antitoxin [Acidobacteriota bacterium]
MVYGPYFVCMKMTMHIDEALLKRVMAATGVTSKTRAVDLALRDLDRRAELKRLAEKGLGISTAELKEVFSPASDPDHILQVAERRKDHGNKRRTR